MTTRHCTYTEIRKMVSNIVKNEIDIISISIRLFHSTFQRLEKLSRKFKYDHINSLQLTKIKDLAAKLSEGKNVSEVQTRV